jgi:hypothetical protein
VSVVQLDFFDREDLNGAVIDTITDEDTFFEGFEMRIALRDLGSGLLTVSRQGISAGAPFIIDIARSEAFVRVLVPEISSDYLFGFFLDSRKSHVLSQDESAGLDIVVGGSGSLYYLSRGIFWNERFSGLSGFTFDEANGIIRFPAGSTPGDVLASFFQEDAANTIAEFIPALTKDFSENTDSAGNAWDDTFGDGLEFAVGTHYLQALRIAQEASTDLDVIMDLGSPGSPQMLMRAFNRYGTDRTSTTFAAGKVLWKAGIDSDPLSGNILTGLEQAGSSTRKPSHVLVRGADGVYQRVVKGGYAAGQFTKAVALDYPNADSAGPLNQAGLRLIRTWTDRSEGLQLEIHPGFDELVGRYMPGPSGSNGHFWLGDDITLKTGGDAVHSILDYHYDTERVTGIRMVLDEAADGSTAEKAALSWHVVPELNEVFGTDGELDKGGVGICCGPKLCSALTPGTETVTRLYLTDDNSAIQPAGDAAWDVGSPTTKKLNPIHQETYSSTANSGSTGGGGGATVDVMLWSGSYSMPSGLAAIIAAGGATVRMQARTGARHGIGISEAGQDLIAQMCLRVTEGATTAIRGTALALHSLASSAGAAKWPASETVRNRVFPPTPASNVLTAVSGTAADDHLLLEAGYRNFTVPVATGGTLWLRDQAAADDLPEDESTTTAFNPWIEVRALSAATGSGHHPDLVGTSSQAAGCDHKHHVLSNRAPTVDDNIDQGYPETTLWTNTDTSQTYLLTDEDAGTWLLVGTAGEHTHDVSDITNISASSLPWFDVTAYGAVGDGSTDDTAAINLAIAALNTAAAGVLYFPAGTYLISSALTTITARSLVKGDGMATFGGTPAVSMIQMTVNNAAVLTFTGHPIKVSDLALSCTSGSTPVSGSIGINISSSIAQNHFVLENVSVRRFYRNVQITSSAYSQINGCVLTRAIQYNLYIDNTLDEDHGDWSISDTSFLSAGAALDAHLRFEGSGGGKVTNCKFNWEDHNDAKAAHAIDFAMSSGSTGIILINNCSIENISSHFIRIVQSGSAALHSVLINGNQFADYTGNTGQGISIVGTSGANLHDFVIANNLFRSNTGSDRHAIQLTNVDNVTLVGNELVDNYTTLYSQSGSTNISVQSGDHGDLAGLTDDDHTQYTRKDTLAATGDTYYASAPNVPARRLIGTSGQVLTVAGGVPVWADPAAAEGLVPVDVGAIAYDTSTPGELGITVTSDWGVDGGVAYYDDTGAAAGEEAALFWDANTAEYTVIPFEFP